VPAGGGYKGIGKESAVGGRDRNHPADIESPMQAQKFKEGDINLTVGQQALRSHWETKGEVGYFPCPAGQKENKSIFP